MERYIIEMLEITKRFGRAAANDGVTLRVKKGEVHALLGENGAGKSTLMGVLFGLHRFDSGEIRHNGVRVEIRGPNDAGRLGIGMVHQHFKLAEDLTVTENIILGTEPHKFGFLQKKQAREKILTLSKRCALNIDPDAKIEDLSMGERQRVEILKMLYRDLEILIFDEPTAMLTPRESEELMRIMRRFAGEGKSVLFITHKLSEILRVSDRCTVLRQGKAVGTVTVRDTTREELTRMMVGHSVTREVRAERAAPKDVVLQAAIRNVKFTVRAGEIVCLAGLGGQREVVEALTGVLPISDGSFTLCGRDITNASPRERAELGMSVIPEDRDRDALLLDGTLTENLMLRVYRQPGFQKHGLISKREVKAYTQATLSRYDIDGDRRRAKELSGGNRQKLLLARELERPYALLVAVSPTRGLDVAACEAVHQRLLEERERGKAVLLVSFDLDEVLRLGDRVLVLHDGEIAAELDAAKTTAEEIGRYLSGGKR